MLRCLSLAVVGAVSALACGPSVQSIYEGNVRFEHCYRLDLDLEIVPTHRRHCWEQWLETFRYGQPRDRVEYARKRLKLFASGDFARPVLELTPPAAAGGSAGAAADAQVTPIPTSAHVPPPSLGVKPDLSSMAPAAPVVSAEPNPGANCARDCERSLTDCRVAACQAGAGAGGAGGSSCARCETDYKTCMRRCFE